SVATVFGIGRHQATLISGQAKPDKTIKLSGVTEAAYASKRQTLLAAAVPTRGGTRPAPATNADSLSFRDD
ncbi:MAG: hypothetical protein AAGK78_12270, partial [Planctomycetota bacterium]